MGILVTDTSERRERSRVIIVNSGSILQCSVRENGDPNSVDTQHSSMVGLSIRNSTGVERVILYDKTTPNDACVSEGRDIVKKVTALMTGQTDVVDLTSGRIEDYYEAPAAEAPKESAAAGFSGLDSEDDYDE